MSAAAVFTLVSNDGKPDRLIFGTDLLKKQMETLKAASGGKPLDIKQVEATHDVPFQARFKPMVPVSMEYQKVIAGSSVNSFGQSLQFSLPQFGDFLTDMVVNIKVGECSALEAPLPAAPADPNVFLQTPAMTTANIDVVVDQWGNTVPTIDPTKKSVTDVLDMGLYKNDGTKVDYETPLRDHVHYCDYPGERMMEKVSFEINGNTLDEYDDYAHVFHRQFKVRKDKKHAYDKNVGQEVPRMAVTDAADGLRVTSTVVDGLQTAKDKQPAWQVWQKLMFWFNEELQVALPSCAIPYGQRYIKINLANAKKLVFRSAAAYKLLKFTQRFYAGATFPTLNGTQYDLTPLDAEPFTEVVKYYQVPVLTNGDILYPSVLGADLYVNNIFTYSDIHDIYVQNIGFSLIRVHRIQRQAVNASSLNVQLNQFKFPIEYIFLGIVPNENKAGAHEATDWHRFAKVHHKKQAGCFSHKLKFEDVAIGIDAPAVQDLVVDNGPVCRDRLNYTVEDPVIDTLSVTAHGMSLYQKLDSQFYNSYVPLVFGEQHVMAPNDAGTLMVNFALRPGEYAPSGHFNVSRAREFFLDIQSSVIGTPDPKTSVTQSGELINCAQALNFLMVSDGSAVLRYST